MVAILGANSVSGEYEISNSLRINRGDTAFLDQTFSSAGNRRTFTISFWVKRGNLGATDEMHIYSADADNFIRFESSDKLRFACNTQGVNPVLETNRVFRDTAAWYHIFFAVDTTQSTASNRFKLYVNGVEETSFATDSRSSISQNTDLDFNNSSQHCVGTRSQSTSDSPYDGYITEFHSIDGTAKAHTDFGEFDDNGVWIPKKYTGTYGTNGFFLEFKQTGTSQNSSGIGADTSGNDNHFAVTNLAATDITTDTCTNNFSTLTIMYHPMNTTGGTSFSEGNLKFTSGTGSARDMDKTAISNIPVDRGKWYCEVKIGNEGQERIGAGPHQGMTINGSNNNRYAYFENDGDRLFQDGSGEINTAYMGNPSNGDIMMLALDMDNKRIYAGNNGQWANGSGSTNQSNPTAFLDLSSGTMLTNDTDLSGFAVFQFTSHDASTNQSYEVNFGNPTFAISSGNTDGKYGNFEYAPPSGYYALCTKRLAEFG
jgi:hypothetical protein